MGIRLIWSSRAARDLDDLRSYISEDDPAAAQTFVLRLLERVNRLQEFPEMGSVVVEFRERSVRQIVHGSYRIIYRFPAKRTRKSSASGTARAVSLNFDDTSCFVLGSLSQTSN